MLRAEISAPAGSSPEPLWYDASGVIKFLERWSSMGVSRSSSSSRGSARAVSFWVWCQRSCLGRHVKRVVGSHLESPL